MLNGGGEGRAPPWPWLERGVREVNGGVREGTGRRFPGEGGWG